MKWLKNWWLRYIGVPVYVQFEDGDVYKSRMFLTSEGRLVIRWLQGYIECSADGTIYKSTHQVNRWFFV